MSIIEEITSHNGFSIVYEKPKTKTEQGIQKALQFLKKHPHIKGVLASRNAFERAYDLILPENSRISSNQINEFRLCLLKIQQQGKKKNPPCKVTYMGKRTHALDKKAWEREQERLAMKVYYRKLSK